ncbi:Cilia- and flagella-associated protein 57 [Podochytrium sp. JEL0797]|nr:Cilia- and flagella-associated protein 57 [Podochytrium sp. JEL0797]
MSTPILTQSHVFGLNHEVRNNMTYLDDQSVLYPAGSQLITYNLEQKTQKFTSVNEGDAITTICINTHEGYAAIAVKSVEKGPYVVMMDLQNPRKKKLLMPPEGFASKEFISVCFSNDGKHIIAQSGGPDWLLCYWIWEKTKLLASVKSSLNSADVHQMSCNPFDLVNTQICITGTYMFRIFKLIEGNFKLTNQQKFEKSLLCHCWVSDVRVIAGTDDSKLLVFDAGELILEISYVLPGNISAKAPSIDTVTSFPGGIIAGTSTGSCVLFEKTDDNFLYKKNKEFTLEGSSVRCIALNPTDDVAVCTLANSQIYVVALDADSSKVNFETRWKKNTGIIDTTVHFFILTQGDEIKCDRLCQPFHHGHIVGMDTCARKPLIATCGSDKSIRIWNYLENTIEVIKFFDEEPLSIALHPSGLYILVGFADCLKLMNVLIDDIRPYWEANIRGCRECRFSNGGQYFASVYGSTIGIHRTWSFETFGYLKGHLGKVKSICWSADDSRITSCGLDGSVFDWSIHSMKKEGEYLHVNAFFTSTCYAADLRTIYAVGNDGAVKVISDSSLLQEIPGKVGYTSILTSRSGKHIFMATAKGSVRSLKSLIETVPGATNDFVDLSCHSSAISRMRISFDDSYLFTCGDDGCLWVYKVQEKDSHGSKRDKDVTYSDEILVTKSDLKEKHAIMQDLRQRVEALKTDNDTQLKLKDLNYSEKLKDLTDKYMAEIEGLKSLTSVLTHDRKCNEEKHLTELESAKVSNHAEIQDMDLNFRTKMAAESEKYKELMSKMDQLKCSWDKQMEDMELFHTTRVSEMSEFFKKKIQERQDDIVQLKNQFGEHQKEFVAHLAEIEEEQDGEVLQIGFSFETKLKTERESLSAIKGENQSMRARYEKLTKEIEENKNALNKMFLEEKRLHGIIKGLEKDIVGVRREMQERDDTIQDKEKRIYDLKKKNQELEKFKFVLDYKIAELKKQVEPREKDIVLLSRQIKEMDEELHEYQKKHDVLDTKIQDLLLKLKATQTEALDEGDRVHDMKANIHRIQNDMRALWKLVDIPNDLKRDLVAMYHKFSKVSEEPAVITPKPKDKQVPNASREEESPPSKNVAEALEEELEEAREREHFERTASTLRHKLRKGEDTRYNDNLKIMHENVVLLTEINILRKDYQASKLRTQRLVTAVAQNGFHAGDAMLANEVLDRLMEPRAATTMLLKTDVTKSLSLPALRK